MLKGAWSCSKLSDKAPSSYRHSVIDWSDLEQTKSLFR